MSLVEILIAIVISTIVITAAYASYSVIRSNYDFQQDMKYMSETARSVVKMIARDIRMAGYTDFDAAQITEAVKITDSTSKCCDRIDIIYDRSSSERVKISYYVQQYNNRHRLFKKIDKCTKSDCSTTSTLQSAQPIADYVEDLQFSGLKNGKVASTGAVEYGMGNKKWFYPIRVEPIAYSPNTKSDCQAYMGNISKAFDGDPKTVWQCKFHRVALRLIFKDYVRIEKIKMHTAAHLDGGNYYPKKWGSDLNYFSNPQYAGHSKGNVTYPYGKNHNLDSRYGFKHIANGQPLNLIDTNVHKCLHPDASKRAWNVGCTKGNNIFGAIYFTAKEAVYNALTKSVDICDGTCSAPNVDLGFSYVATKELLLTTYQGHRCMGFLRNPPLSDCKMGYTSPSDWLTEIADISFYGETFGEPVIPTEVEIGLLLRSPNEFERNNKSFSISLGNRTFTSNDKYMRDSFSTSVIVRNLYYANQ